MAMPISLGECFDLVDRGIKLYNKIKHEVPDLIAEVGERIETLQLYLRRLKSFLQNDNVLVKLHPSEKHDIENILNKMKSDVSKVIVILDKYKSGLAPGGLEWKYKFVPQTLFALGSSPKELEDLGRKLDQRQDELRDWLQLMLLWGQATMLNVKSTPQPPSPSSPSQRTDYNILFVDSDNECRSVNAEAYTLLCKEWTVRTGGLWRINLVHSAGVNVKSRSGTALLQQKLGSDMFQGNRPPSTTALSALFDSLPFTYAYKGEIRQKISQRRSRGLTENMFAVYDFIIVFNRHNLARLEELRDALAQKHGQAAPEGKGKIVLLGGYGTTGYKEIFNARKGPDGEESVENWNATNSNIKTSVHGFLKKELAWIQPSPGAVQNA